MDKKITGNNFYNFMEKLQVKNADAKLSPEERAEKEQEREAMGTENPLCIVVSNGDDKCFILDILNRDKAYWYVLENIDDSLDYDEPKFEKGVYMVSIGMVGTIDYWGEYDIYLTYNDIKKYNFEKHIWEIM